MTALKHWWTMVGNSFLFCLSIKCNSVIRKFHTSWLRCKPLSLCVPWTTVSSMVYWDKGSIISWTKDGLPSTVLNDEFVCTNMVVEWLYFFRLLVALWDEAGTHEWYFVILWNTSWMLGTLTSGGDTQTLPGVIKFVWTFCRQRWGELKHLRHAPHVYSCPESHLVKRSHHSILHDKDFPL